MFTVGYNKELLTQWIDETDLSDEEFARRAGIGRATLYRARKGNLVRTNLETLVKISQVCGKPVALLLTAETRKNFESFVSSS